MQRGILERVDSMTTVCEDYANRHDMKCKGYRLVRPYTPDDSLVGEELAVEGEEELAEWGADEVDGERGVDNLEEEEQDVGVVKMEEEQDEAEVREGNQRSKWNLAGGGGENSLGVGTSCEGWKKFLGLAVGWRKFPGLAVEGEGGGGRKNSLD